MAESPSLHKEANREAAEEALRVARRKYEEGDDANAVRFAEKSVRLFELPEAVKFASWLQKYGPGSEAAAAVCRVLEATDHYAVFEVTPATFEPSILKSKYRQLSLLLHPDKNSARGAEAAFQRLGEANVVLSDSAKREAYDVELRRQQAQQAASRKRKAAEPPHARAAGRGRGAAGWSGAGRPPAAGASGVDRDKTHSDLLEELALMRVKVAEASLLQHEVAQLRKRESELLAGIKQLRNKEQAWQTTQARWFSEESELRRQLNDERQQLADTERQSRFQSVELSRLRKENQKHQQRNATLQEELDSVRKGAEEARQALRELQGEQALLDRPRKHALTDTDGGGSASGGGAGGNPLVEAQSVEKGELARAEHCQPGEALAARDSDGGVPMAMGEPPPAAKLSADIVLELRPIGPVDGRRLVTLPLYPNGSLILGRSSRAEPNEHGLTDARISRRHVLLEARGGGRSARATALGSNAIQVRRPTGARYRLSKGDNIEIAEGDTLILIFEESLPPVYCYAVHYAHAGRPNHAPPPGASLHGRGVSTSSSSQEVAASVIGGDDAGRGEGDGDRVANGGSSVEQQPAEPAADAERTVHMQTPGAHCTSRTGEQAGEGVAAVRATTADNSGGARSSADGGSAAHAHSGAAAPGDAPADVKPVGGHQSWAAECAAAARPHAQSPAPPQANRAAVGGHAHSPTASGRAQSPRVQHAARNSPSVQGATQEDPILL